ncbi:reverse transcriptase [Tanacetum coccineum]
MLEKIRRSLKFSDAYYVDPVGRSGGLALWWNSATGLNILNGNKNLITAEGIFSTGVHSYSGFLCFVYAPHDAASRSPVWNAIIKKSSSNVPCLIIGDLNLIGSSRDKEGGSSHISSHIEEFHNFTASANILEVPYTGLNYTWSNKRCGEANIRERIDRAFGNINLFELYPYHSLLHKPLIGSDHAPLIYCSQPLSGKRCSRFHFESMWTTHEDCETVVREAWLNLCADNNLLALRSNLSNCASKLTQWSKCRLGNNRKLIDSFTRELEMIQGLRSTPETMVRERLQDLEVTWMREEMYWHQRSRINWLNYGDRNSRFFHLSAIHRGQRNKISALKNAQGDWLYDPKDIQFLVLDHFRALFQTTGPRDLEEAISVLNPVVSQEMNLKLQACVSSEEIHRATKQLGGLKAPGEDGFSGRQIQVQNSICDALKVKLMGPKDKYLGLPSVHGRKKGDFFGFLLEKVLQKLQGWKQNVLSQAGREVLIKSVIQAIPTYAMQCYLLPKDPKVDGGLGFRDLESFNTALLAKQGWRLLMNPGSFWGKVIKGLYFPRSNFLTTKRGSRPSWLWNSLLHGRDLLLHGVRWQVGNGQSISFWTQKWVPFNEDFFIQSPLGPFPNGSKVSYFIQNGAWNTRMLRRYVSVREAEMISGIPISQTGCQDKLVWHFDAKQALLLKRSH